MSKVACPPSPSRLAPGRRTGPTSSSSTMSRARAAVEMRQQHRGADRGMAGERQFPRRREDAQRARAAWRSLGGNTNTVSGRLNSRAIVCMAAVSSPSASSTTASGLPAKRCAVNTSRVKNGGAWSPSQRLRWRNMRARGDDLLLRLDQQDFARAGLGGALEHAEDRGRRTGQRLGGRSAAQDNGRRTGPRSASPAPLTRIGSLGVRSAEAPGPRRRRARRSRPRGVSSASSDVTRTMRGPRACNGLHRSEHIGERRCSGARPAAPARTGWG